MSLRFLHQRERFVSALVRPDGLAADLRGRISPALGVSIMPPYDTYVLYEVYIAPGLIAMIQLFNGDAILAVDGLRPRNGQHAHAAGQPGPALVPPDSKLDRPASPSQFCRSMPFLSSPTSGRSAAALVGLSTVFPALILSGLMLGSLGMFLSSLIQQLKNFAGVMNFVIFPMFFASSALYPLWRVQEFSVLLYEICRFNPFTQAVELIRFALYGQVDWTSLVACVACTLVFLGGAVYAYNPSKGLIARRGGPGAGV